MLLTDSVNTVLMRVCIGNQNFSLRQCQQGSEYLSVISSNKKEIDRIVLDDDKIGEHVTL